MPLKNELFQRIDKKLCIENFCRKTEEDLESDSDFHSEEDENLEEADNEDDDEISNHQTRRRYAVYDQEFK